MGMVAASESSASDAPTKDSLKKKTANMGNVCRDGGEDGTLFVLGLIICLI